MSSDIENPLGSLGRQVTAVLIVFAATGGLAGSASGQQTGALVGSVATGGGGPVIPGVRITLPDLRLEAVTDDEGRFRLSGVASGRHEVVAELLGCPWASRTVSIEPGKAAELNFTLGPRAISLDGILVTGVASDLSHAELPFTVETLEGERLRRETAASLGQLIQGRIAGGRVVQGSGLPGEEADILLRGATSLGGAQLRPLVVVDGIIAGHSTSGIDPMDIERIEVLKGATAAALYGSRAHAGVIEITTRRRPSEPPGDPEPLLIVDGVISDERLADLDTREIVEIRMLPGPAAVLLAGPRGQAGIIQVTTVRASDAQASQCPDDLMP
ncbi:MAG: TonB-dependent receptor plug domain-containing protein [Gemmatimonadetes bacterium]|nr:TonB-dependent receptor plug domain-containing protein [Gemmatimonadota bacterium]